MALTPYRDRDSLVYRSRSSSFSSSTSGRNFLYQEVFEIGGNALVRSYNCGQIFAKDKNGQTIQATQVRISNFISPVKNLDKLDTENNRKSLSVPRKFPVRYYKKEKPSKAKISLQFSKIDKIGETVSKCEESTSNKVNNFVWKNMKRTFYLNLIVITLLAACYIYKYKYCNQRWDTQEIFHKLRESVFGQELAILKIENILNGFHNSRDNAVICFTGSIGVGKTFVSSIIYKNFPWVSNEYIEFFDVKTEETLRTKKYSSCGVNLLVIDGINTSVAKTALNTVKYVIDKNDNAKFLVILIFRTRDNDEQELILKDVKNTDKKFNYISFRNLNHQDIKKCFIAELKRQNKTISQTKLNELLTDHMKFCNISKSFQGCKNVLHEVSRLNYYS